MSRILNGILLSVILATLWLPRAVPASAGEARLAERGPAAESVMARSPQKTAPGESTGQPTATPVAPPNVQTLLAQMTVADKVGQLFLITFQGNDLSANSDVAALVRDYRVGGVVLLPSNGNFRSIPIQAGPAPSAGSQASTGSQSAAVSTPQQIAGLADALQRLAMSPARPITSTVGITPTASVTATIVATETISSTATPASSAGGGVHIPLLIGLDWPGDDSLLWSGSGGFTPTASQMAIGATWSPELAEKAGQMMGQELRETGVNLLLGPTLDVLDVPRPGNRGDLGVRAFGGDPFWVGAMGQAFIRGVKAGSQNAVVTAAKHFPGQGGSDRRPEDEVATVQKAVEQLQQIELAPFAAVTAGGDLSAPGTTSALMTSHIRYRGFQGNIRELTPPISLAPELQDLMGLGEFAPWRAAGGILISDALGVPALRRYYDPSLKKFPYRQVAQDAFLAGNDLLYLSRFALTDDWAQQLTAIKETILFFQGKYSSDPAFRARVDASVERILNLKLRLYGDRWQATAAQTSGRDLQELVGKSAEVTQAVARSALTLIYPGREELADRLPAAPLADEKILIFTDTRAVAECAACEPVPLISTTALQDIMLKLYGPGATGQLNPKNIASLSFGDLERLLSATAGQEPSLEKTIADAKWIIFALLDDSADYPQSAALHTFLAKRSDSLRDKRLVVLAFDAPYYLDTTEISKLTAYLGVYGKTTPFLETAVRGLFREFTPAGSPPVTITGINYELIRQLEPAPGQIISLAPMGTAEVISGSIQVGSQLGLETGIILDRRGHPVPDGTPVEFHLLYPAEALALAPQVETTVGGKAHTMVALDRAGDLWITAQAGEARDSTRIELKVGGDTPGSIATVVPTASPEPTVTATLTPNPTEPPTITPQPSPLPLGTPTPNVPAGRLRVPWAAFLYALMGTIISGGMAFVLRLKRAQTLRALHAPAQASLVRPIVAALWAGVVAWAAYLLYAVGWLPGATRLQAGGHVWMAGLVTLAAGMLPLLWTSQVIAGETQPKDSAKSA